MATPRNRRTLRLPSETKGVRAQQPRPVEVVRIGPHRSQRVRIRWLDGEYEGLEEWVLWRNLLTHWDGVEAVLEEERKVLAAVEASEEAYDELAEQAMIEYVFGALPEPLGAEVELGVSPAVVGGALLAISNFEETVEKLGLDAEELLQRQS